MTRRHGSRDPVGFVGTMPRAYATIYVPGRTTSHKRSSGPIRNRNSLSDDTTRLDGHSLHMSWSHSSLTTGTEIVIAMVSISHSSTHNTVSHHNIVWVDNKAESRGDPFSKRRKWSDARDADARRHLWRRTISGVSRMDPPWIPLYCLPTQYCGEIPCCACLSGILIPWL